VVPRGLTERTPARQLPRYRTRITKPELENNKSLPEQQLTESQETDSADYLAQILEQCLELAELISIWPNLSIELREAVLRTAGL